MKSSSPPAVQQAWADTPFTLIETPSYNLTTPPTIFTKLATEMALVHNIFLRGMNSIYTQAPHVHTPADAADLFIFAQAWLHLVEHHHGVEETHFFADLERFTGDAAVCAVEKEQHAQIHAGLDALGAFLKEEAPRERFEWARLKAVLDSFMDVFAQHLREEIDMILGLEEKGVSVEQMQETWRKTEKAAIESKGEITTKMAFPLLLTCRDVTHEGGAHKNFPPIPFFVPYLVKYIHSRKYAGAWKKFSPCDVFGNPVPLHFLSSHKP